MRVLVITPAVKERAEKVRQHALAHRESLSSIVARTNRPNSGPGLDPNFVLLIHDGYKVVYTVEQHPGGWFHHISVSVDERDKNKPWPSIVAVDEILKLFGLPVSEQNDHAWKEDECSAINLLYEFVEPDKAYEQKPKTSP